MRLVLPGVLHSPDLRALLVLLMGLLAHIPLLLPIPLPHMLRLLLRLFLLPHLLLFQFLSMVFSTFLTHRGTCLLRLPLLPLILLRSTTQPITLIGSFSLFQTIFLLHFPLQQRFLP